MSPAKPFEFIAFPEDGFVGFSMHKSAMPRIEPGQSHYLLRFKSPEGFKNFMIAAMEAAAATWPEMQELWEDKIG